MSTRKSWDDYGISKERYRELKSICRLREYNSLVRSVAHTADKEIAEFIILSVTQNRSFDRLEFDLKLGRIPCGRTDFYAIRRKFYYLLDDELRRMQGVVYKKTADLQGIAAIINSKKGGDNVQIITLKAVKTDNSQYAIALGSLVKNEDKKYDAYLAMIDKKKPKAKYEAFGIHITGGNKDTVLKQVRELATVFPPTRNDVSFIDLTED